MSDVEDIKARLDIVDIIQEYVPLKPAGANMKARCPFHDEKTPSFMVHKGKQIWRCFGCGEGGDVFSFLQKIENVEFTEALKILATRAGIQLKQFDPQQESLKSKLKRVTTAAVGFYEQALWSDAGQVAREYLIRDRGLSEATIKNWHLGLAGSEWDSLSKFLEGQGFTLSQQVAAGLVIQKERADYRGSSHYDRFRNRIMFPLTDGHGQPIGFTGRLLPTQEVKAEAGKYVNTPETPIFRKAQVLYGLYAAKPAIRAADQAIVVEGQMDVLASHQAKVTNVVANSGTALTPDQLRLLGRLTQTITLALDTDKAGETAQLRAVRLCWQLELDAQVLSFPDNAKDPADIIKSDPKLWQRIVAEPQNFMDYYINLLIKRHGASSREAKRLVAKSIIPLMAELPDPIERSHFITQLADRLGVESEFVKEAVAKVKVPAQATVIPASKNQIKPSHSDPETMKQSARAPELILALGIKFPELFSQISQAIAPPEFTHPQYGDFYKELWTWYNNTNAKGELTPELAVSRAQAGQADSEQILAQGEPDSSSLLANLELLAEKEFAGLTQHQAEAELERLLKFFKKNAVNAKLRQVAQQIRQKEAEPDATKSSELNELTTTFKSLTKELKKYE